MLWVSLPDQRAGREVLWMSRMPGTEVTAMAAHRPSGDIEWIESTYRRPVKRFVEAGALAWIDGLDAVDPSPYDWVTTLELCSLVTKQSARWKDAAPGRRPLQAVVTWENLPHQPLYYLPPYRGARRAALHADLMLCFIDAARDHLLEWGYPDEKIAVVKPGVDTEVFHPADVAVDKPVIVFTSPLAPNKGIDRVLDAMRIVKAAIPDAELHVAGRGEMRSLVEERAAEPGSGVHLHGNLDRDGVARLLREAALFVTAPRRTWKWTEQFGLAYLEALATGLPIVTTVCGTNHEAVPPPNDLVADDAGVLAEAMIGWLEDPARRAAAGASNRAHVLEHHEIARQCARMGEAFAAAERRQ
ncbi:MAG: glycosyltransferase family 4 protein [Aeromicrobium sp.]